MKDEMYYEVVKAYLISEHWNLAEIIDKLEISLNGDAWENMVDHYKMRAMSPFFFPFDSWEELALTINEIRDGGFWTYLNPECTNYTEKEIIKTSPFM